MQPHVWEWTTEGAKANATGVTKSRDRAMDALEATLLDASAQARGAIVPIVLADGVRGLYYLRFPVDCVAVSDGQSVRWECEWREERPRLTCDASES